MARCDECQFFHAYPPASTPGAIVVSADGIRGGGECRLRPPVLVENETLARFPVVANACWCGSFEERREWREAGSAPVPSDRQSEAAPAPVTVCCPAT